MAPSCALLHISAHDSLSLELETRQTARFDQLAGHAQQQAVLQSSRDALSQVADGSWPRVEEQLQLSHRTTRRDFDTELADLRKLAQHAFNRTWKNVDAAHHQHGVSAPQNATPQARERAPAGTCR